MRTDISENIAKEFQIDHSVALDIMYLRELEERIASVARLNPDLRDFPVHNLD